MTVAKVLRRAGIAAEGSATMPEFRGDEEVRAAELLNSLSRFPRERRGPSEAWEVRVCSTKSGKTLTSDRVAVGPPLRKDWERQASCWRLPSTACVGTPIGARMRPSDRLKRDSWIRKRSRRPSRRGPGSSATLSTSTPRSSSRSARPPAPADLASPGPGWSSWPSPSPTNGSTSIATDLIEQWEKAAALHDLWNTMLAPTLLLLRRPVRAAPDDPRFGRRRRQTDGSSLPGFMIPAGSSAPLIARSAASRAGSAVRASSASFDLADAVLGRDRAARLADQIVDEPGHRAALRRQPGLRLGRRPAAGR